LRKPVADEWVHHFSEDTRALTTFCRLSVVERSAPGGGGAAEFDDMPAIIGGYFLGEEDKLLETMRQLLPATFPKKSRWFAEPVTPGVKLAGVRALAPGSHPHYQPGPPLAATTGAPLSDTCAGVPFPHKVSSTFPKRGRGGAVVQAAVDFLDGSTHNEGARQYVSLHGMGGAAADMGNDWSAFAFRDKPFMLQYQAWWANKDDHELGDRCMAWIRKFRTTMSPHAEGAFINFPDKDLVDDPDSPAGRKELLTHYYGTANLGTLIRIKRKYDSDDLFRFGMSVPTE
jgi:hypothetical protein